MLSISNYKMTHISKDIQTATEILTREGIGILATDTLYGIVGSALYPEVVERIYNVKKRNNAKPLIVLIAKIEDIEQFSIILSEKLITDLNNYWPGPYSILLPVTSDKFEYLHRGTNKIAFRLPNKPNLIKTLIKTGPLVAPSANIEGIPPAKTIQEAQNYFGDKVDFYIDEGSIENKASTILSFNGNKIIIERE